MERFLYNMLIATQILGLFATLLLFLLCFLGVHVAKLAQIGWSQSKPKKEEPPSKPTAKEKTEPVQAEPVYYIVERKKSRAKPTYGEPKKISFK